MLEIYCASVLALVLANAARATFPGFGGCVGRTEERTLAEVAVAVASSKALSLQTCSMVTRAVGSRYE